MFNQTAYTSLVLATLIGLSACSTIKNTTGASSKPNKVNHSNTEQAAMIPVVFEKRSPRKRSVAKPLQSPVNNAAFANKLSNAALSRLRSRVRYDGSYIRIAYPWGDVPPNIGVCTDVVIRSYRKLGIDLQQQVHRDISAAFNAYPNPKKWGLSRPDTNIDHRRVYNLRAFFARRGAALPITHNPVDYKPGDLVTWMVGKDLPHIGIVVNRRSKADPNRFMIVHNIAYGPQMEDVLFRFPITGHYRYTPAHMKNIPQATYASSAKTNYSRGMSQAQLIAAANILGTPTIKRSSKVVATQSTKNKKSIKLATLTDNELQRLLIK